MKVLAKESVVKRNQVRMQRVLVRCRFSRTHPGGAYAH
jgi:hypothetical protein